MVAVSTTKGIGGETEATFNANIAAGDGRGGGRHQ